jgi:hypothetical protein
VRGPLLYLRVPLSALMPCPLNATQGAIDVGWWTHTERHGVFFRLLEDERRHGGRICACAWCGAARMLQVDRDSLERAVRRYRLKLRERFLPICDRAADELLDYLNVRASRGFDLVDAHEEMLRSAPSNLWAIASLALPFTVLLAFAEARRDAPAVSQLPSRAQRRQRPEVVLSRHTTLRPANLLAVLADSARRREWLELVLPAPHFVCSIGARETSGRLVHGRESLRQTADRDRFEHRRQEYSTTTRRSFERPSFKPMTAEDTTSEATCHRCDRALAYSLRIRAFRNGVDESPAQGPGFAPRSKSCSANAEVVQSTHSSCDQWRSSTRNR